MSHDRWSHGRKLHDSCQGSREGWHRGWKLHDLGPGVTRRVAPRAEVARSGATLYIQKNRGSVTPKPTVAGSLSFNGSLLHEIDPDLVFEISKSRSGSFSGSSEKENLLILQPQEGLRFVSGYVSNTTPAPIAEVATFQGRGRANGWPNSGIERVWARGPRGRVAPYSGN